MLVVFGASALLELLLHTAKPLWRARKPLAALVVLGLAFASSGVWMWRMNALSTLFLLISLYRIFNNVRLVRGRIPEEYLRRATWRTAWRLLLVQLAVLALSASWRYLHINGQTVWLLLAAAQCLAAAGILAATVRRLRRTAWPDAGKGLSDRELPSVSVAIPARNETEDLQRCLESLVASDYSKLEVLVLDDCSQTKRTPEIIRSFAHDGVRFVQGEPPEDTWLPKNQAYHRLSQEASGDYILFCCADIRFKPDSIRLLVNEMLRKKKLMLSILPERATGAKARFSLVQSMRYWWELAPPRRIFNRPPVLSSCWMIARQALDKTGGFASVARAIVPEAHFAKELIKSDAYSFMRSSRSLGIESAKTAADQRDTAVRMRYPQLHRRPQHVMALTTGELLFLVLPFALSVAAFWAHIGLAAHVLTGCAAAFLAAAYLLVARSTRVNVWWFALIAFPFVVLADIALVHYSMWRYEFSEVLWKGRNICIPVMHMLH